MKAVAEISSFQNDGFEITDFRRINKQIFEFLTNYLYTRQRHIGAIPSENRIGHFSRIYLTIKDLNNNANKKFQKKSGKSEKYRGRIKNPDSVKILTSNLSKIRF